MSLPAGFQLQRYVIDEMRSEAGNFSKVYLAHDARGKSWAIKEFAPYQRYQRNSDYSLSPRVGKSKEFQWALKRFREEGQFLAATHHPHIVHVEEHFAALGTHYVVMELLEESLEDRVKKDGSQSQGQVLRWTAQLMDALRACHERGTIHLDVSPNNIMFRKDGSAVLIDFGFGRLGNQPGSRSSKYVACEHYSAPEKHQHTSRDLDGRADVYSLAAVMNFALTGIEPTDCRERMSDVEGNGLPFQAERVRQSRADQSLREAIDRAFRYRKAERFQSISAFASAIGPSLPVPAAAGPDPNVVRTEQPSVQRQGLSPQQRKQIAALLAFVMILLCGAILLVAVL